MDGFKDLFQGGMCNPNMQAQNSNNAFKSVMGSLNTATHIHPVFGMVTPEQSLNLMMQNMDTAWGQEQTRYQQIQMQQHMMMSQAWEQEKTNHELFQRQLIHKRVQEQQWLDSQSQTIPREWQGDFVPNNMLLGRQAMFNEVY